MRSKWELGFSVDESCTRIYDPDGNEFHVGHDVIIEQYTGLKDNEGKEVWEGDIYASGSGEYRYIVVYSDGMFVLQHALGLKDPVGKPLIWGPLHRIASTHKDLGIHKVGNIHENPELLNHEKAH